MQGDGNIVCYASGSTTNYWWALKNDGSAEFKGNLTISGNATIAGYTTSNEFNGLVGNFNTLNAKAITTDNFSAQTINASKITTGTLNCNNVTVSNLTASKLTPENGYFAFGITPISGNAAFFRNSYIYGTYNGWTGYHPLTINASGYVVCSG